ncbi:hypothetical protein BC830DRAFT_1116890 [Chytriomyces sp. MP71]|nr:hypothetical protein BC830DRAFT_1116890 [Chytriomyces sp. MP71]
MPPTSSLISRKNAASSGKSGIDQSHVSHTSNLSIVAVNHKKSASHPDMKALQKELERDPKNVPPLMKVLKRTQKQYLAVKKGFFASLVALLVESHNSALTLVIISIEFLQNLAFCFADVDWGPQGHWMGFVLTLFQVEEAVVKYAGGDAIFVLVAISVALIIIMIVLAFYVVQSFMKSDFNKGVWPLRLLRTLVSFLASVFFLPVMYSLFTIFRCPNQESSTCNSDPLYIVLRILSGFSLPVFFAFTMLMSMTYFNPNPKASSISARPTARLELLELSSKTLLAIFFVFAVESPVLRETVTLICSFSTAVYMWIYIPYYKKEINLYRFTLICQVIWGSIMAIVVTTVGDGQADRIKNLVFYIYLGGILPGILISFFFFNRRQNHATSFAIACQNFKVADTSNFNAWEVDETGTDGEMEKRFWNHNQVEIATRFLITETDPKAIEIADKIFLFGTKKFPNSSALMVQYAIFFLVHKEDPSVAASYLKKAEKLQMLVDTEFTIYQQQQEIKSGGATIGNKKLDAVDRVEFKQLMKEAKQSYKEARASIANFWLAILSAEDKSAVDTAILMQHVSQMERSDHQATESFTRLIARYPLSVKVLSSYADFLDDIHNNHEESELIRRRIKRICDAGLSDDVNHIATPIGANKGVHSSIAGNMMTGSSSAHMTKKSKKAYKEYRKQVYHYSKGNSALLTWMIRGIQVFFIVVAAAQLYVTEYGSQRMRDGISYLQATATCRSAFITVHTDLRNMQSALLNENSTALMIYASEVNATIRLLAQTSSDLYYSTHNKASVNNIWAVPHIPIVFYNGPGTSNNTLFPLTLMDATLMYIRRVNAAIYAILDPGSNTKTIDVANLDWRFALDNGITVILDTYTELEHVIASESRNDVFAMEYAHIGIFAFSLTCLAAISYFLFWPVISKAKTERETSLRAFLQIPKEVTNTLYSKYFDPESASRESLNESNNDDDDKEGKGQSSGIMESLKNTTGYMTMMKISRNGLITIAIFLTASFICDLILLSGTTGIPSSIADAFDVPARGNRIVTVASDVAYWSNTTFSYSPESRNYLGQLLLLDVSEILSSQVALLYGSTTYPHYESNVDSSLLQDIYTSGLDSSSLYGVVSEFIDGATVLANTIPIMPSNPKLLQIGNNLPKIVEGYMYFYDDFLNRSNQSIMLLTNLAYGILAIMVVVIITVHFMYWKRIMNYLIKTENERTLKLLLMIPVEIVADIDSLRELLHLKRTTISGGANSNAAPPPPDIRVMSKSAYTSGRPSFTMHASFGKQFPSEIDENADDEGYVAPNDLMVPPVPSLNVPSSGVASYLARESRRRQSINFTDQPNLLVHKQERISTTEEKRISSYSDGSNRQSKAELDGVAVPRRKSDGTALTGGDMLPKEREKKGSLSVSSTGDQNLMTDHL